MTVDRAIVPWRWRSLVLAPVELLAAAWSIPVVVMLIAVPIAVAVSLVLWLAQFALRHL